MEHRARRGRKPGFTSAPRLGLRESVGDGDSCDSAWRGRPGHRCGASRWARSRPRAWRSSRSV